jgi:ankyrin repeat protein
MDEVAGSKSVWKNVNPEEKGNMNPRFRAVILTISLSFASVCAGQVGESEIRLATGKSVVLLQKASTAWFDKRSCTSCHHQDFPLMVFDIARRRNVAMDQSALELLMTRSFGHLSDLDRAVQGSHLVDPVLTMAYALAAAAPLGLPHSASTGAYARLIARRQLDDGHWLTGEQRPPSSSPFTATALAVRALQAFLPEEMGQERRMRIDRAEAWLEHSRTANTEDRVYKLFGLSWAKGASASLAKAREELLAEQRPDGGWGQMSGRPSDAYATGEALAALNEAAVVPASHPAYQKGLRYLLATQKPDGTWFVGSRIPAEAPVSPPYLESGLPYGHHQFISAMATCWAAAALLLAIPASPNPPAPLELSSLRPAAPQPWTETVLFGGKGDVQRLLDSGWSPNSATSKGTTALMMAAPDLDKAALLVARGANVNAKSSTRYTALMIAASHHATKSVNLFLEHGAELQSPKGEPALFGATPLFFAAWSGDVESLNSLHKRGSDVNPKMLVGGMSTMTALEMAAQQGDSKTAAALIRNGANVDEEDADCGFTALDWAVFKDDTKLARLLVTKKAGVNHVDKTGSTPLHWAASVDFGDTAILQLLLGAGAALGVRNHEGLTPLQLAVKYKNLRNRIVLDNALTRRH